MKTLTIEEASPRLGRLLDLAIASEQIQICKGNKIVELRPAQNMQPGAEDKLPPREALHRLQETSSLTRDQADSYLREVWEERRASRNNLPI